MKMVLISFGFLDDRPQVDQGVVELQEGEVIEGVSLSPDLHNLYYFGF